MSKQKTMNNTYFLKIKKLILIPNFKNKKARKYS